MGGAPSKVASAESSSGSSKHKDAMVLEYDEEDGEIFEIEPQVEDSEDEDAKENEGVSGRKREEEDDDPLAREAEAAIKRRRIANIVKRMNKRIGYVTEKYQGYSSEKTKVEKMMRRLEEANSEKELPAKIDVTKIMGALMQLERSSPHE